MYRLFLFLIPLFFLLMGCPPRPDPPTPPPVLAFVNGSSITEEDLHYRLYLEEAKYGESLFEDKKRLAGLKHTLLDQLITQKLIVDWGKRQGVILTDEDLAMGMANLKKGYTDETFETMLQNRGVPYALWRDIAQEKLFAQKILHEKVYSDIQVTEKELRTYYKNNMARFKMSERIRARHIVTDSEEKGKKILKRLLKGENFAKVAIMNSLSPDRSQGGDLGYFAKGTYPKEFDKTCFNLSVGQVSRLIKSPYGYHIFKVIDKKPAGLLSFEEAAPQIQSQILKEKMTQVYEKWLIQLKEEAQIQIIDKALKRVKIDKKTEPKP